MKDGKTFAFAACRKVCRRLSRKVLRVRTLCNRLKFDLMKISQNGGGIVVISVSVYHVAICEFMWCTRALVSSHVFGVPNI